MVFKPPKGRKPPPTGAASATKAIKKTPGRTGKKPELKTAWEILVAPPQAQIWNLGSYIHKLLATVNAERGIDAAAVQSLNNILLDVFKSTAQMSRKLVAESKHMITVPVLTIAFQDRYRTPLTPELLQAAQRKVAQYDANLPARTVPPPAKAVRKT